MPVRLIHPPNGTTTWASDFQTQLTRQYAALRMPTPPTVVDLRTPGDYPELLIYFATAPWNATADPVFAAALETYADEALHLLPVIYQEIDAGTHLAPALQRFNAFIAARHLNVFAAALVDETMTLLWQRRRQRRIFISYRRSESLAMARQLYDHFSARSFSVFLDERSIEPGVDFQHELKRHLDDSDAVLVLVSPGLTTSRWVREELNFAKTRRIGLLGIIWPGGPASPVPAVVAQLDPDQQVTLAWAASQPLDPSRELDKNELQEVDRLMFEGRSKAVARRTTSLIDEAEPALSPDFSITTRRADGDLELDRGGNTWIGRIAPFRPSLYDLWRWWDEFQKRRPQPDGIMVLYPQVDSYDSTERAFRAVCDTWGKQVTPKVELRTVHL